MINYNFDANTGTITGFTGILEGDQVIIPDKIEGVTVTHIEARAFQDCLGIKEIIIPDSVVYIGEEAFYNCRNVERIIGGDGVQEIGSGAFSCCLELTHIVLGKNLKTIGSMVFQYCMNLKKIIVPDGLISMNQAFSWCDGLEEIIIGKNVEEISDEEFDQCYKLKSIVIPDNIKSIGSRAFHCSGLEEIKIGNGVEVIKWRAFANSEVKNIILPNRIREIEKEVFEGLKGLSVTIPRSVERISYTAFSNCENWSINYVGTEEEWNEIDMIDYEVGQNGLMELNFLCMNQDMVNNIRSEEVDIKIKNMLAGFLVSIEPEKISEEEQRLLDLKLTKEQIETTLKKAQPIYQKKHPELDEEELKKKIYVDLYNSIAKNQRSY